MNVEVAIAVRSWRVGRFAVEMTVQRPMSGAAVHATVEWTPNVPVRLSCEEWAEYRAGRDQALRTIGAELGIAVAVLEL